VEEVLVGKVHFFLIYIDHGCLQTRARSCNGVPPQTPAHRCPRYTAARALLRQETSRIPKLRIDLLLYSNMGANAMAQYIRLTEWQAIRQWMLGHAEPNRQHRAKKSRMGDTWPTPRRTRYGLQRGVRRRDRELEGRMGEPQGENPGTQPGK